MQYFVTLHGETVKANLTREQAIKEGKKLYTDEIGTMAIGIGIVRYKAGKKMYRLLPFHFSITD